MLTVLVFLLNVAVADDKPPPNVYNRCALTVLINPNDPGHVMMFQLDTQGNMDLTKGATVTVGPQDIGQIRTTGARVPFDNAVKAVMIAWPAVMALVIEGDTTVLIEAQPVERRPYRVKDFQGYLFSVNAAAVCKSK